MIHKFNLTEIFKMQAALDEVILSQRQRTRENTYRERTLAFLVELGEFTNEARDFKYWSNRPASPRDVLLEEYVDGIHFIIAQALLLKATPIYQLDDNLHSDKISLTIEIFKLGALLLNNKNKTFLEDLIKHYLLLGVLYGFTESDIVKHYNKKNKINYERIANNY